MTFGANDDQRNPSKPTKSGIVRDINMASFEPALFLVEHHVQDKEAFDEFFAGMLKSFEGKSFEQVTSDPMWKGNKCILTGSSVNGQELFCFWQLPADSTTADFQAFIDEFTGGEPTVKNIVHKVEASMGLQNLNNETYINDLMKMAKEGSVYGFADNGELFFVHHNILSKEAWDETFKERVGAVKGKSSTKELVEAWEVGEGVKPVMWSALVDEDAICMWSVPTGWTDSDFQAMIDKFCGEAARNDVFKIQGSTCSGSRLLHPDFYTQDVIAYANSAE